MKKLILIFSLLSLPLSAETFFFSAFESNDCTTVKKTYVLIMTVGNDGEMICKSNNTRAIGSIKINSQCVSIFPKTSTARDFCSKFN